MVGFQHPPPIELARLVGLHIVSEGQEEKAKKTI
jgi:hypothetical protein